MVSVTQHEKNLRAMRCLLTHSAPVTLHHCHGGSMKQHGWHVGTGQRQNPFLQIPIDERYHTGLYGIDSGLGVRTWEETFGTQVELLERVNSMLPYDIWEEAKAWEGEKRGRLHSVARRTGESPSTATGGSATTDGSSTP